MSHKGVIEFIQSTFAATGSIPLHVPIFSGKEREYVWDTLESNFISSVGAYVDRAEQMMVEISQTKKALSCQVFNIGNSASVELTQFIEALEKALDKTAKKNLMDIQAGDVPATHANLSKLEEYVSFRPQTSVIEGVKQFVEWYLKNRK